MRLWVLTNDYPPSSGFGISTYMRHLTRLYRGTKDTLTVFTLHETVESIEQEASNITVIRFCLPAMKQGFAGIEDAIAHEYFTRVYVALQTAVEKPDVIEMSDCLGIGYYLVLQRELGDALLRSVILAVQAHSPRYLIRTTNRLLGDASEEALTAMEQYVYDHVDGVMFPSRFLQELIVSTKRKTHIPLPFESLPFTAQEKNIDSRYDFMFVGKWEYRKGIVQLLPFFEELWRQGVPIRVALLGIPIFWEYQREDSASIIYKKYAHYIFQGALTILSPTREEDIGLFLNQAKYVVVPSLFDNSPYVCLQAAAFGKPVISSRNGGQRETSHEDLQFSWENPQDIIPLLKKAMTLSPEQYQAYQQWGLQHLQAHAYRTIVDQRQSFFADLKPPLHTDFSDAVLADMVTTIKLPAQLPDNDLLGTVHDQLQQVATEYCLLLGPTSEINTDFLLQAVSLLRKNKNCASVHSWFIQDFKGRREKVISHMYTLPRLYTALYEFTPIFVFRTKHFKRYTPIQTQSLYVLMLDFATYLAGQNHQQLCLPDYLAYQKKDDFFYYKHEIPLVLRKNQNLLYTKKADILTFSSIR